MLEVRVRGCAPCPRSTDSLTEPRTGGWNPGLGQFQPCYILMWWPHTQVISTPHLLPSTPPWLQHLVHLEIVFREQQQPPSSGVSPQVSLTPKHRLSLIDWPDCDSLAKGCCLATRVEVARSRGLFLSYAHSVTLATGDEEAKHHLPRLHPLIPREA